jgi:Tol biopolymer transport system component
MRVVTRILDVSTWPRLVRNGAGLAWVGGLLALAVVWAGGPVAIAGFTWHAPHRAYHAVICSSAQVGSPSWSPDGRQIVFAQEGACSSALYVIDRDGSGLHRLAESRRDDELPAWSPDGRTVSFVDESGLELIDVPAPRLRQRIAITGAGYDDASSWTRAGDWIAFSISGGKLPGIYLVRPDGRSLHRIAAL